MLLEGNMQKGSTAKGRVQLAGEVFVCEVERKLEAPDKQHAPYKHHNTDNTHNIKWLL